MDDETRECVVVLCTVPNADVGDALARGLVEGRHAACVNRIGPMHSTYRWKGEVHAEAEHQLFIKTTREALDGVREFLATSHPYEVPELVALDAVVLSQPYARWLREQIG
jgi:periplasmic divalent cation tolerance protein